MYCFMKKFNSKHLLFVILLAGRAVNWYKLLLSTRLKRTQELDIYGENMYLQS